MILWIQFANQHSTLKVMLTIGYKTIYLNYKITDTLNLVIFHTTDLANPYNLSVFTLILSNYAITNNCRLFY